MTTHASCISLDEMIAQARAVEEQARRVHEAAVDHLRSLEAAAGADAPARETLQTPKKPLTLDQAAAIAGWHRDTVATHAPGNYGDKVGGRWAIDPDRFDAFRFGKTGR